VITGGAGYIGSHLATKLIEQGHTVKIIDKIPFTKAFRLKKIKNNKRLHYLHLDISNLKKLVPQFRGYEVVIHFAANLDIQEGVKQTDLDLKQGTILTYNVLEAMRLSKIKKIIFPSSSTIYGNAIRTPTPEDAGMLFPLSLYGASKLASEGMISAYCYLYGIKSWVFRFGTIIGSHMERGVIFDFVNKIKKNQGVLEILGDGEQIKDYIQIDDLVEGILHIFKKTNNKINVFNLSSGTTITVNEIAKIILEEMGISKVAIRYKNGPLGWEDSGWAGNVKSFQYNISNLKKTGWSPKLSSKESVRLAVKQIISGV
jgi:UDP-glucose 4-epimerase